MNATPHTVIGYSVIKLIGGNPNAVVGLLKKM